MKNQRCSLIVLCLLSMGHVQAIDAKETMTDEQIIQQAVQVMPTPRQLMWQEGEFLCFIHFGVNTFSGREWGTGKEDPAIFTPEKLDTDQWCRVMKAAGMTKTILTVKHHDGFCLWQSRYTDHSVASSPWRGGKGDVLRDMVKSCKKYGLQVGVYLSPADLYQIENAEGLYGNLSEYSERVIPRSVPGRPFKDKRSFTFRCDDYNEYFMNQLFELLTEYGPIHEVWFDGAHPKRKGGQTYTRPDWIKLIRALVPDAVISIGGPDVRWCGNEGGGTRLAEWNVISLSTTPEQFEWRAPKGQNLGKLSDYRKSLEQGGCLYWWPAETNTSIRHGWFWRDEKQPVRGTDEMLDIWYKSVGGNTVFLLNVPPNTDGLFPKRDSQVLEEMGTIIKKTFTENLAKGATAQAFAEKGPGFGASKSLDGDTTTCWMPPEGTARADLIITLTGAKTFNRIMFQEQIRDYSQRIASFSVDAWLDEKWQEIASGQTVGYKRICIIKTVTSDRIRIRVLDSRVCPTISEVGLYFGPIRLSVPAIGRSQDGLVSIQCDPAGPQIFYTLDDSQPTRDSLCFTEPFSLLEGGTVRARAFDPKSDRYSDIDEVVYGPAKSGWRVVRADSEQFPGERADYTIDGDPSSIWHTQWSGASPDYPHEIVIDLGKTQTLTGFTYLPRQRGDGGVIGEYAFYVSHDPNTWKEPVVKGQFGNILNNPILQRVPFKMPVSGRYIRLEALASCNGKPWAGAAEIDVITDAVK